MFGNISQILEMKKKAEAMKARLEATQMEMQSKGILIRFTADKKIISLNIDPTRTVDNRLESDLVNAFNEAMKDADKASAKLLEEISGGMPGLAGLFGK